MPRVIFAHIFVLTADCIRAAPGVVRARLAPLICLRLRQRGPCFLCPREDGALPPLGVYVRLRSEALQLSCASSSASTLAYHSVFTATSAACLASASFDAFPVSSSMPTRAASVAASANLADELSTLHRLPKARRNQKHAAGESAPQAKARRRRRAPRSGGGPGAAPPASSEWVGVRVYLSMPVGMPCELVRLSVRTSVEPRGPSRVSCACDVQ
jgi:hypothetical protein